MSEGSTKPVIFISYSHKDEPDHPRDGEVQWLSFVRTYLQPAIKHSIFELFVDEHLPGGASLKPEIERKLRGCDVFVLLISPNSTASDYIIDTEIKITRDREANGENVVLYPILLTPTPKVALDKFKDKVIRPQDAKPLSGFPYSERIQKMSDVADEIAAIALEIASRRPGSPPPAPQPAYVHVTGLPETAYERLVGRELELKCLDDAWSNARINILSLVAEGGAGKSALANEWLKQLQNDGYRGADKVLGWSFYSQGSKQRATSADEFLNWAMNKLDISLGITSSAAKGEAIAEIMMQQRVLLLLDGLEPLQQGPGPQIGYLKDFGLRAFLRRFAATPPGKMHGLVVLTSRLAVKDIGHWKDGAAPVIDIDRLSDDAGAALLRDNGVWGTDKELERATHDFGGNPLALALLASFLKEAQVGDVRRRDRIRAYFADADNPRHDHARRIMESYEKDWLVDKPVLNSIMWMVGLFDRPASGQCLKALRAKPAIEGFTAEIVKLDDATWQRAVAQLRELRLLAPPDPTRPDALDAHPLVREWFGERLQQTNGDAWRAAHGRLYEHLRDTTKEGITPTLEQLAPLYQAMVHGCRAGRYEESLDSIFDRRLSRRMPTGHSEGYIFHQLGAYNSALAALNGYFEQAYEVPVAALPIRAQAFLFSVASFALRALGRLREAVPALRAGLSIDLAQNDWINATQALGSIAQVKLVTGDIQGALDDAKSATSYARKGEDVDSRVFATSVWADTLHQAGQRREAKTKFKQSEKLQKKFVPLRFLGRVSGFNFCELLMHCNEWDGANDRARYTIEVSKDHGWVMVQGLEKLVLGRVSCRSGIMRAALLRETDSKLSIGVEFDECLDMLRAGGHSEYIPRGHLARAAFRRSGGNYEGAARDLDEVEEISEPGPMRLYLCDMALERARLAFARSDAFAPLNGLINDSPPKPERPGEAERKSFHDEAATQLAVAADYIKACGYHRRDEELAELQAVLRAQRTFASLPPRV